MTPQNPGKDARNEQNLVTNLRRTQREIGLNRLARISMNKPRAGSIRAGRGATVCALRT